MPDSKPDFEGNLATPAHSIIVPENIDAAMHTPSVEDQLAAIIRSAREVAIVAEELLRENVAQNAAMAGDARPKTAAHAVLLAPLLLSATHQQLTSLLAMMRTV
jgi:hypothetical protein